MNTIVIKQNVTRNMFGQQVTDGWTPLLAAVEDGERRVFQITDWIGGGGDKPPVGLYLGEHGLVPTPAEATDIGVPTDYSSRNALAGARIPAPVQYVRTAGYAEVGDGGGALYRRVAFEPGHGGKVQSADGAWWEIAEAYPSVEMFGGSFTDLETYISGSLVDLGGKTYTVTTIPTGNIYVNGFWLRDGDTLPADSSGSIISGTNDSGGRLPAFGGGVEQTITTEGATTKHLCGILWSQNCRSEFVRAGNISSIYSWAYGNVSLNGAARQSVAGCPQAVNLGTEECEVYGFRGANVASHYGEITGASGGNYSSRYSRVSAGRHGANVASVGSQAGRGWGARLTPVIVDGSVDSVTIDEPGQGYFVGQAVTFWDRSGPGSDAVYTVASVDVDGGVTGLTKTDGGANYSDRVNAVVTDAGVEWTGNFATVDCTTAASNSANVASSNSRTEGVISANVASLGSTASGARSATLAANNSTASGMAATTIGSTGSLASGDYSATIAGNQAQATEDGAVVVGRRVINAVARSFALGESGSGSPSTANRRFHVLPGGNVQASGSFTGSTAFTDYAEYFENAEHGAIPLGTLVALDGRKVRPTQAGDDILGVVSGTALVVAGDSPFTWQGRYLTGEFGEILYGDVWDEDEQAYVRGPLENPEYDPGLENIPRSERPDEWTCVGLLGQVHVRVDETVATGDHVAAGDGGVGTTSAERTNMRCMEIRQPYDPAKGYAVAFCLIR